MSSSGERTRIDAHLSVINSKAHETLRVDGRFGCDLLIIQEVAIMSCRIAQLLQCVAYHVLAIVKLQQFTCNSVLAMTIPIK